MAKAASPLDFVIVGAQRAGTTYLNACLMAHPEVYLCPDEVPYFEDPFFSTTPPVEFHRVFAKAAPGQRLGIQRPEYLAHHECASRIHSMAPEARVLAVLRDPVARAVSAYFWYMQFGLLPLAPLDVGMVRLVSGWSDPAYPHASEIIRFGLYGSHVRHWLEVFGRDQVLVVMNDELRDSATFARIYSFLGVDETSVGPTLDHRTNAGVYDLRRLRVLRARRRLVWSWDDVTTYRYRPRRLRRPLRFLPNAIVVGFDRLVLSRVFGNEVPVLSPHVEAGLRALYADDIGVLEEILDRHLSAWREPPATGPVAGSPGGTGVTES